MESQDLRIFRRVAEELSFSKAAEQLGYVQSNVTNRIRKLEEELGKPLFTRSNKGVSLLPAGEKLLGYANQILDLMELAEKEMSREGSAALLLGASQTIAAGRLPLLLGRYCKDNPTVNLTVRTGIRGDLIRLLTGGKLDGIFISGDCEEARIQTLAEFKEPVRLVSAAPVNRAEELLERPIIINTAPDCPYRQLLLRWFEQQGVSPKAIMEFDSLESVLSGVKQNIGISLLPLSVIPEGFQLTCLPKGMEEATIRFMMRGQEPPSPELRGFIELLQTQSEGLA